MAINDGSANASAGAAQLPNLLDSYGANRPAWSVAGVDYHVGVPDGLALKDPSTISMAGVSVNASTKMITITGNNVTLDGYDFSLNGGWGVIVQGSNASISDSKFVVGSNGNAPILGMASASNLNVTYCTIDGNNNANVGGLIEMRGSGIVTVEYSWLKNSGGDMIQMHTGGKAAGVVIEYNLLQNAGMTPGAHGDYTEFLDGPYTATINFNTTTQNGGTTQGFMVEPDIGSSAGTVVSGEIGNNVFTAKGGINVFTGVTVADIVNTFTVHDNYFDPSNTLAGLSVGGVRGGPDDNSSKSIYINNVNMKDGSIEQDSNAPTTPPVTAPSAPKIASFSNDSGVVGDGITNDNTLTLTGTAVANSTVKVFDGATQIGTTTANSSGAWSYTTAVLADGAHSLTAKASNASGTSTASAALAVKIDTVAPNAPTIAAPTNNASGGVNLTGTAEANSTVKIFDGTTQIGTATANSSGAWNLSTGALATGNHSFTAKAMDAAGNTGVASSVVPVTINSPAPTPPSAPTISSFSNDSGVVGDNITNDNTLTLTGTAAANTTVKVFDGTTQIGTATANSSGAWTYTTAALADGSHNLTAKVTDAAGQTSAASATLAVKIDTTAPAAPVEVGDSIVNGNQVLLNGTAEANSTVKVYDGLTLVGTVVAKADGTWSVTTSPLSDGSHNLTATATDVAGNTSAASLPLDPIINTTPPAAPKIASFSNDSGVVGDGITNDNTLTLTGTAVANSTVKVFDGTTQIGTATANSSGAWSFTTAALADGAHSLTAKATDAAGLTSVASSALAVKIDTVAPNAPSIAAPTNNASGGVNLTGTAEANSTVKVFDGATQIGTATANSSGAWTLTTGALATGNHSITAKATDAAGNTGVASAAVVANIPAPVAPAAPKIVSFSNDSGVVGDGITNDNTLTLTGTAVANSTVKVFDGATQIGTATANNSGAWTYTTAVLADGGHNLTAKVTDAAGQTSAASATLAVKIDTSAPVAPTIGLSSSISSIGSAAKPGGTNVVSVTGSAEANSTVKVFDGTTQIGTATANSNGVWSFTTGALSTGNHTLTAKAMDAAGNTGVASTALVVKASTTPATPHAPKISSFLNDSGVVGDGITNAKSLILTGTADAGSLVKVFDGTTQVGTATANSSGAWSYTTPALAEGNHSLTAKVTDASGQTSAASAALAVKIDTIAPAAPKIASSGSITNADHVTLTGTAEANSTVKVFDGTKQIGTATANEKGAWTYAADKLADGNHSFTTKAMDAAGNTSAASTALGMKVDTHAPTAEFTKAFQNWNDTVTFKGTADPNSSISIYDNGSAKAIGSVKVGSDGTWSFKTPSAVSDTVHNFTATVTDKAGNTSSLPGSVILGTNGNDVLKSTSGNDLFKGNGGSDTFAFAPNFGADVISNFSATGRSHDVVQFSKSVFDSFADVLAHASQSGHDVVIDAGGGNTLTLKDTKLAHLDKTDFHFA